MNRVIARKKFLWKKLISFSRDTDKKCESVNAMDEAHHVLYRIRNTDRVAVCDKFFICFVKLLNVNHLIITFSHFK